MAERARREYIKGYASTYATLEIVVEEMRAALQAGGALLVWIG